MFKLSFYYTHIENFMTTKAPLIDNIFLWCKIRFRQTNEQTLCIFDRHKRTKTCTGKVEKYEIWSVWKFDLLRGRQRISLASFPSIFKIETNVNWENREKKNQTTLMTPFNNVRWVYERHITYWFFAGFRCFFRALFVPFLQNSISLF